MANQSKGPDHTKGMSHEDRLAAARWAVGQREALEAKRRRKWEGRDKGRDRLILDDCQGEHMTPHGGERSHYRQPLDERPQFSVIE